MDNLESLVGIMNYFCKNFPKNRGGCAIILYNTVAGWGVVTSFFERGDHC